jgi:protein-disulfide isomerase
VEDIVTLSRRRLIAGFGTLALAGAGRGAIMPAAAQDVSPEALHKPGPLKSKYIDSGKVRLIFREFPTQPATVAIAGFMLARCSGDKYFPMLEALFDQQRSWGQDPYNGLLRIARQAGFTQESFETCLKDSKLAEGIQEIAVRGNKEFGVESTPTFFVNGKKHVGALSIADLEKIVDPLLTSG